MMKVTFDRVNNQIIVENDEVEEVDELDIPGFQAFIGENPNWHHKDPNPPDVVAISKVIIPANFEGLVFNLIDIKGNSFSTEIIGQVANGEI